MGALARLGSTRRVRGAHRPSSRGYRSRLARAAPAGRTFPVALGSGPADSRAPDAAQADPWSRHLALDFVGGFDANIGTNAAKPSTGAFGVVARVMVGETNRPGDCDHGDQEEGENIEDLEEGRGRWGVQEGHEEDANEASE